MIRNRLWTRIGFGVIGALSCLLITVLMEIGFSHQNVGRWLDGRVTPTLVFRSDITRRLERAGAKRGDIQITLAWNNRNDLDLWCVDPNNEKIFYGHATVRSGGELDVDKNAHPPYDPEPVEHIYWPVGKAPAGRYQVYVDYYDRHSSEDLTPYRLDVTVHGRIHTVTGTISKLQPNRLVYEFDVDRGAQSVIQLPPEFWRSLALMAIWTGLIGLALSSGLLAAQGFYVKRRGLPRLITGQRACVIIGCSLAIGAGAGIIGQALFAELPEEVLTTWVVIGRTLGMALSGGILGLGIAYVSPNIRTLSGLYAGILGGLMITLCYEAASVRDLDSFGRVAGATLFGLIIGLLITLYLVPPLPPEPPIVRETLPAMEPLKLRSQRTGSVGVLRVPGTEANARKDVETKAVPRER